MNALPSTDTLPSADGSDLPTMSRPAATDRALAGAPGASRAGSNPLQGRDRPLAVRPQQCRPLARRPLPGRPAALPGARRGPRLGGRRRSSRATGRRQWRPRAPAPAATTAACAPPRSVRSGTGGSPRPWRPGHLMLTPARRRPAPVANAASVICGDRSAPRPAPPRTPGGRGCGRPHGGRRGRARRRSSRGGGGR